MAVFSRRVRAPELTGFRMRRTRRAMICSLQRADDGGVPPFFSCRFVERSPRARAWVAFLLWRTVGTMPPEVSHADDHAFRYRLGLVPPAR